VCSGAGGCGAGLVAVEPGADFGREGRVDGPGSGFEDSGSEDFVSVRPCSAASVGGAVSGVSTCTC
jgi:hypothetical protein